MKRIGYETWLTLKSRPSGSMKRACRRPTGVSLRDNLKNLFKMGKQMTASAGASIDDAKKWASIDFKKAHGENRRLQMRIAKA